MENSSSWGDREKCPDKNRMWKDRGSSEGMGGILGKEMG
jgi:hypothetical protein